MKRWALPLESFTTMLTDIGKLNFPMSMTAIPAHSHLDGVEQVYNA
jgi:hypothetical protein